MIVVLHAYPAQEEIKRKREDDEVRRKAEAQQFDGTQQVFDLGF